MNPLAIIQTVVGPIAGIFQRRQERKMARATAQAKLAQAKQDGNLQLDLNDQELEQIHAASKKDSWLDEYVTVSIVSIVNVVVLGGILAAFGHAEVLEGIALSVRTLVDIGVDVAFLLEAVILSAVGLVVWRKL